MSDNNQFFNEEPRQLIKVNTTNKALKDKIKMNVQINSDAVYWYIRFNIPLDETTVSEKTMGVTDDSGYIMRTDISYSTESNMIIISPLDSYEQNVYYILNISKKVKSARGQNLKSQINIIFKLLNNQISDYKILKSNVTVPTPKPRPKDYEKIRAASKNKIYTFDPAEMGVTSPDKLPPAPVKVNIIPALAGLVLVIASLFLNMLPVTLAAAAACVAGSVHLIMQIAKKTMRAVISYNRGVSCFNKGEYNKADSFFKKAFDLDEQNEMVEYALNKTSFYL